MSDNVNYQHKVGTTAALDAIKAAGLLGWDTTKGHAIFYQTTGALKHLLSADTSNNLLGTLGNVDVADGVYYGLGAAKGRLVFDDEATDTITVKNAALLGENYFQIGQDVDNADFAALILKNTNDPLTTEVVQSVSINAYLRKTTDGGLNYTDEQAGAIVFGKDADFFHATTEADCDGNIQFKVAVDGTLTERLRIGSNAVYFGNMTDVEGAIAGAGTPVRIGGADKNVAMGMFCFSDTDAHRPRLDFYRSGSDTYGTKTDATVGAILGQVSFYGVNNGGNWDLGAYFHAIQTAAAGAKVPCDLVFGVSSDSAELKRMRIAGLTGQVTIGDPDTADAVPLLRVWKATAGAVDSVAGTLASFENDGDVLLSLLTTATGDTGIVLADKDDNDGCSIILHHHLATPALFFTIEAKSVVCISDDGVSISGNNAASNIPSAVLDVLQDSATGAKSCALLNQADIDQPFMKFIGQSADSTNAKRSFVPVAGLSGSSLGTVVGVLLVDIQDDNAGSAITDGTYYIPFYAPTLTCH